MLKIAYDAIYKYQLPEGHRFPMEKYELLPEQLLYEGTVTENQFFAPGPASDDLILLTHTHTYFEKLKSQQLDKKEIRKIGFPMTPTLIERGTHIAHGTYLGAKYALQYGIAMNIAGGTHHSFSDRGEGFCVFNDIAIAANALIKESMAQRILIIDLDVHQGNGTAKIFEENSAVFTFSMHGEKNYPLKKEHSDLDIGLQDKTDDDTYLKKLQETLEPLIDKVQPDFIFFLSGVDVLETDKLGRLHLTLKGCKQRDRMILECCKRHRIPVMVSMGGGYSQQIRHIIEAHANTFRLAQEIFF